MKKQLGRRVVLILLFIFTLSIATVIQPSVHAEETYVGPMVGFMMSPMTTSITLRPGESYTGSFWIMNPEENTASVNYTLDVKGFYRDNEGNAVFEDIEGRSRITEWITIDTPTSGTLAPSTSDGVKYTISIPENATPGGQYAAITATSTSGDGGGSGGATLKESVAMAHTIFVEVEGQIIREGEIFGPDTPGYLFDGNIVISSKVTNTSNVHGTVTYTMEIFPLFSDQPIYSNAADPEKQLVLPDRNVTHETTWENTPAIGLFNVYYKVELQGGIVKELKKLVVKCPVWFVFLLFLVLISLITFGIYKLKSRHKNMLDN